MPKKTYKRMTQREKEQRKSIRAELRAEGLIPPVKPRLNRAAFRDETIQMWKEAWGENSERGELMSYYLACAITAMLVYTRADKVTPEIVGALKLLRIAVEYRSFEKKKRKEGARTYKIQDLYDEVIDPILKL